MQQSLNAIWKLTREAGCSFCDAAIRSCFSISGTKEMSASSALPLLDSLGVATAAELVPPLACRIWAAVLHGASVLFSYKQPQSGDSCLVADNLSGWHQQH